MTTFCLAFCIFIVNIELSIYTLTHKQFTYALDFSYDSILDYLMEI